MAQGPPSLPFRKHGEAAAPGKAFLCRPAAAAALWAQVGAPAPWAHASGDKAPLHTPRGTLVAPPPSHQTLDGCKRARGSKASACTLFPGGTALCTRQKPRFRSKGTTRRLLFRFQLSVKGESCIPLPCCWLMNACSDYGRPRGGASANKRRRATKIIPEKQGNLARKWRSPLFMHPQPCGQGVHHERKNRPDATGMVLPPTRT